MKVRMKKKDITQYTKNVIAIGYCNLQTLLRLQEPFGYIASNTYGWQCDLYDIGSTVIATGYEPFGYYKPSYEMQRVYEIDAEEVMSRYHDGKLTFTQAQEKLYRMATEFCHDVIEGTGEV